MDSAEFVAGLGFDLDEFQVRALDALDSGRSVLVAAPTGSGKTVVAEYAVAAALDAGGKAFYTTPLKALSNQKFGDLTRRHGPEKVGLLTGDNAINGDAPIVVMTTEVLRNMIYADSPALQGLRYVVLDEVHYLQNEYRGPVWEEVIIHTPLEVDLVCLSATVSNAEDVAGWIQTVRGATDAVIEERRPVELHNLFLVGDRSSDRTHLLPTHVDGRPNREVLALEDRASLPARGDARRPRPRLFAPRRPEVVHLLHGEDMLPAIYFIFSRAACDDAVQQCLRDGIRLTTQEEREQIDEIVEGKLASLSDDDLHLLDYGTWLSGLEAGIAAHHAGMVPPFKEAVEQCFAAALVKMVFATETLSLGINMPARSVVIERLSKYSGGDRPQAITPGEYTQLTGRAGRRGIDPVGYAIVLYSRFVPFEQVAHLASARTYELRSSFRPTYNMAANLVRRYAPDQAHHLLNLSFAQYQTDAAVVHDERRLERAQRLALESREKAVCELGDVAEYRNLLRRAGIERSERRMGERSEILGAMQRMKPGDVLLLSGKDAGRVAIVSTPSGRRHGDLRLRAITTARRMVELGPGDFFDPPKAVGRIELPTPPAPKSRTYRAEVAELLQRARLGDGNGDQRPRSRGRERRRTLTESDVHPVARCPDARLHVRALDKAERFESDAGTIEQRIRRRSGSLARQFDRVLRILEAWGYVDGWSLTEAGDRLSRLYHEADLLVSESLQVGLLDGLSMPEVAAVASVFTFEARGPDAIEAPTFPTPELRERWRAIDDVARELNLAEKEAGLPLTRPPDPGFVEIAHGWAAGRDLSQIVDPDELSGGDFVRNVKQLIDLLRQIAQAAPVSATASAAQAAADAVFRGVVAASSVVGVE